MRRDCCRPKLSETDLSRFLNPTEPLLSRPIITFLHRTAPKVRVVITRRQCLDVNLRSARRDVKVADLIDIPPSDGRRAPENLDRFLAIGCELLLVHPRQEQGIALEDGACDEP
jgi:hypothetical protein